MSDLFIGRNTELDYYKNNLEQSSDSAEKVIVYYLKSPRSSGKKSFHRKLGSILLSDTERGWIWIRPLKFAQEKNPKKWLELFNKYMVSNLEAIKGPLNDFQENFGVKENEEEPERTWLKKLEASVAPLVDDETVASLKVVVVLDDYDDWETAKKEWFSERILNQTQDDDYGLEVRYLLAGKESLLGSEVFDTYWDLHMDAVIESQLNPISEDEIKECLRAYNLPVEKAQDLHKRSKGVPKLLMSLLEPLLAKSDGPDSSEGIEEIFQIISEQQKKWLLWAAHLGQITAESFNIYCDTKEAKQAYEWLLEFESIKLKKYPDKHVFDGPIVSQLMQWEEKQDIKGFKEDERKASEYHQIVAVIPKKDDRIELTKLSIFKFFNKKLLQEIYPEEWEDLLKYTRTHKDFFQVTDHNIKIVDDIYSIIKDYTGLIPIPHEPEYVEVIENIWNEKRESVIEDMAEREKNLEVEESAIAKVREELRNLLAQIRGHEGTLNKANQRQQKKSKPASTRKKVDMGIVLYRTQIAIGITAEFFGIVLLYIGILFADQLSYAYSGLGIFMILAGFFWPYKKRLPVRQQVSTAPVQAVVQAAKEPRHTVHSDKQLRLLNMELTNLENKRSVLSRSIAKQRRALSALDSILSEPYV